MLIKNKLNEGCFQSDEGSYAYRDQMMPVQAKAVDCAAEIFSGGRLISFRPAITNAHFIEGAQK